jgi:hypothetical protein
VFIDVMIIGFVCVGLFATLNIDKSEKKEDVQVQSETNQSN